LEYLDTSLDELLKRGLWSQLLADAGLAPKPECPDQERLAKGLRRVCHVDDAEQIRFLLDYLKGSASVTPSTLEERRLLEMLHVTLWGDQSTGWTLESSNEQFRKNPAAITDLEAILSFQLSHAPMHHAGRVSALAGPLTIHAHYTRDEILVGLGHWTLASRPDQREGVLHIAGSKVDVFFVSLQKTEDEFSPTTMYEDYLISNELFHWQSQSNTSAESPTGQRYTDHRARGYTPLLFVREQRVLSSGLIAPYAFLGACDYVSHTGSRPMSIIWKLRHSVPARLSRTMARQAVG
jgi:hypothetical protein